MSLSEDQRDTALSSVALVRLVLQQLPPEETTERLKALVGDRDEEGQAELLFRTADLAATILEGWHKTVLTVVPEGARDEVASPEELLNDLVRILVQEAPEEPDDSGS